MTAERRRIARLQFTQGAIDFLTFSQLSENLLNTELTYLSQLHEYNQLVIELGYLTENQQ